MSAYPVLMHTALDATDCRGLAESCRPFPGRRYRAGDEVPADGSDDDAAWLVLLDPAGHRVFALQEVPALARPAWPAQDVPKQMHHDFRVPSIEDLQHQRQRAEEPGPPCCPTARTTAVSRCMCSLTPPAIPSAFSSALSSEPPCPYLPPGHPRLAVPPVSGPGIAIG